MPTQITGSRGTPVWIPHPELAWRPAVLLDDPSADKPVLVQWFDTKQTDVIDLDKICNGASPPLRNLSDSIQQADLASLPVLNEPEVLNNLKLRFCNQHEIYTYCGLLLIALNPYKDLPIYGKEFMEAYNQNSLDSEARRDPHIFAIADEALTRLKQLNQNQSIIISGESGAGKTVSANCVLQYFATIAGARCADMVTLKDTVAMHTKVLASSPLLEAFGNARTVRNDNSSRFGKFLEVGFSSRHRVVQAHMRTYLLEKSRVVFQGPQERNYHIFYQLLAASEDPSLRQNTAFLEELALAPGSVGLQNGEIEPPADFHYAHREHCKSVKGIDDLAGFSTTLESMRNLDFSDEEVRAAFVLVAATLHLGNVTFTDTARDGSQLSPSGTRALSAVLRLLERDFDANAVNSAGSCLCNRIIHTVEGQLVKPLSVSEATNARDALAKYFYQVLFEWVVVKCNAALETKLPPRASIRRKELSTPRNFIGVLDIYGFESFEVNSFEQFCINYANEKLQQRFITHVFKMEQEEYVREGLEWAFVDYYDNAPCIELLEGDMGIIALLNDECKMPKPQDKNWLARLCQEHLGRSRDFSQSKMWTRERFTIQHFSEQVEYTVEGFVEKNADRIIPEHAALLAATKNPIIKQMVERFTSTNAISVGRQGLLTKPTVVTQFSASLKALLETLDKTTVHYIRCIKPNDQKAPFTFSPQRTIQQLRACGVLQTIKISAAGYPSRWTYEDFVSRYWQLCPGKNTLKEDVFKVSEKILTQNIKNSDQYRLGRTKIFFGNGVLAHLERLRSSKIVASATIIQKNARGWLARQRYCRIRRHLVMVQAAARQWLAKARVRQLQEQKAKSNFTQASVGKDAKDHTWTFSLLRRHKSPHSETTLTRKRAKSKEALQTTIGDLQSQLTERENEIAAKDSQIAALLEKQEQLQAEIAAKANRQKNKKRVKKDSDVYEEVNYRPRSKQLRNLHKVHANGLLMNDSSEDGSSGIHQVETTSPPESASDVLLELQRRCAILDTEKEELYRRLETYQENYAIAQTRHLEDQKSIRRLEEWIESQNRQRAANRTTEVQTDKDDVANLESILQIQREASRRLQVEVEMLGVEKSQLRSAVDKKEEELRVLKEQLTRSTSKVASTQAEDENDVARLTHENLQLREQLSTTNSYNRRLVLALKYFAELVHRNAPECLQMTVSPYFLDARQLIAISQSRMDSTGIHDFSPKVGMLRCLEGQEAPLIHRLVKDLDVSKTTSWPPLVVAELIFLLARGADAVHDEEQISAILSATIKTVQAELKKHPTNTELTLFWLANIFGLRNCIQEFGGGQGSQETVAEEEEVYYLENYDVSLFRPLLTDLLTLTFHRLMANIRETVFPPSVITGALLEYEPIPNLSCQALTASRSGGLQPQNTWLRRLPHFQRFTKNLDRVFEFVTAQAADTYLVWHVFYQIFYYITASALNTILLRKDLCNWARGAQIRHNLATLETWLSERDLIPDGPNQESNGAPGEGRQLREILSSLIQVCLILQSKKGASDKTTIESVCQLCPNLTISQVTRLLSRCTMVDGVEEQAQPEFLHAVRRRLRELRPEASCKTLCCGIEVSQSTLLLDSNNIDSLGEIPFRPLPNSLASFKIPTELDDLSQFIVTIET